MSAFLDEPTERPRSAAAGTTSSRRTSRNSKVNTASTDDWLELAVSGADVLKTEDTARREDVEKKEAPSGRSIYQKIRYSTNFGNRIIVKIDRHIQPFGFKKCNRPVVYCGDLYIQ